MRGRGLVFGYALLILVAFFTSGCWDRHEIQDRNFVLAVALDTVDEGKKPGEPDKENSVGTYYHPNDQKKYRLSLQILKFTAGGTETKGAGQETRTFVLTNTGASIFAMVRDLLGQSSKTLYFEHLNTIVISEKVLREAALDSILDFFIRDPEMRWRIRVYVTSKEARPLLEYQPPTGEPGGIYIARIAENHIKNMKLITARTDLGYTVQAMENKADFYLPRIELEDKTVRVGGAAAFHNNRFVGYIDDYAAEGLKILRGTEKSALIQIPCPEHPGEIIILEVFKPDTRLTPHIDNGKISFSLDVLMKGNIGEGSCSHQHNSRDPQAVRAMEIAFAEEIKRNILYYDQVSKAMGIDFAYAQPLKAHYPKVWDQVKDQWEEIFPTIPLEISVNVTIRELGIHQ